MNVAPLGTDEPSPRLNLGPGLVASGVEPDERGMIGVEGSNEERRESVAPLEAGTKERVTLDVAAAVSVHALLEPYAEESDGEWPFVVGKLIEDSPAADGGGSIGEYEEWLPHVWPVT